MVNVIGLGYIGLPTALMLAAHGVEVVGTDYNEMVVNNLKKGLLTFKEPGIEEVFEAAKKGGITFQREYAATDVYIVAVPTPYDKSTKKVDASYIISAVREILKVAKTGAILIIESTIPPSTIDNYIRPVVIESGRVMGKDVHIAHAPERIIPGNMIYELKNNNRTIGTDDRAVGKVVKELYASFCKGEIIVTDIRTAEMTKVVENTYRDINIAYANELAKICRADDLNVYEIIQIANMHPRVNILTPGPGVGGHCISVDPWFLVGNYPGLANIILSARKINDGMPDFVLERLYNIMKEKNIDDVSRVGLYGLTYKENVDDVRESPTLQLLDSMDRHLAGGLIKVYDPYVKQNMVKNQYHNLSEFIDAVDIFVIMVAHNEIKENMEKLKGKIILDTRNICNFEGVYKL